MKPGESTNWEDLFDNPLHTVIAETILTEKFIEDEEGTDLPLPRMLVKKPLEVKPSCMRVQKLTDILEVARDTRCLFCMEKRQNHERMNSECESE